MLNGAELLYYKGDKLTGLPVIDLRTQAGRDIYVACAKARQEGHIRIDVLFQTMPVVLLSFPLILGGVIVSEFKNLGLDSTYWDEAVMFGYLALMLFMTIRMVVIGNIGSAKAYYSSRVLDNAVLLLNRKAEQWMELVQKYDDNKDYVFKGYKHIEWKPTLEGWLKDNSELIPKRY